MDPLTIVRLLMAGGQLAGGLVGMKDREEDNRGQERIRQLLAQAQARNLRQGQAIAGSGVGISPALAQRVALQSVSESNEAATQAALSEEAALAERDRDRDDKLMGAKLGALGAFGSQILTALAGDDDDDDEDNKDKSAAVRAARGGRSTGRRSARAGGVSGELPAAAGAPAAAQADTGKPPEMSGQSALEAFLQGGLDEETGRPRAGKDVLSLLEHTYGMPGPWAPRPEDMGTPISAEDFAARNLGMRAEDIPIGLGRHGLGRYGAREDESREYESTYGPGGPLTRRQRPGGPPLSDEETVQDVIDRVGVTSLTRPGGIAPAETLEEVRARVLREAREQGAPTNEMGNYIPPNPFSGAPEEATGEFHRDGLLFEGAAEPGKEFAEMTPELADRIAREHRLGVDRRMREVNRLQNLANAPGRWERDEEAGSFRRTGSAQADAAAGPMSSETLNSFTVTPEEREEHARVLAAEQAERERQARRRAIAARNAAIAARGAREWEIAGLASLGGTEDHLRLQSVQATEEDRRPDDGTPMSLSDTAINPELQTHGFRPPRRGSLESVMNIVSPEAASIVVRRHGAEGAQRIFSDAAAHREELAELGVPEAQQRELEALSAFDLSKPAVQSSLEALRSLEERFRPPGRGGPRADELPPEHLRGRGVPGLGSYGGPGTWRTQWVDFLSSLRNDENGR